jgi:hypothetical protein
VSQIFRTRFKQHAFGVNNELMKSRLSICQAMDCLQIYHWYYAWWKKTTQTVDNLTEKDEVLPLTFSIGGNIKKLHRGHPSSLAAIKSDLSCSIFELHEQGL